MANAERILSLEQRDALVETAREYRLRAYAPYSEYPVGAAVLAEDGRIFGGCNVENAMYGATICAERAAVFRAIGAGAKRILALAVVTLGAGSPCGFCRQVLSEFAEDDARVFLAAPAEEARASEGHQSGDSSEPPPREFELGELLPHAWGRSDLSGQSGC